MQARQLLQGLRAALHAIDSRLVALRRSNGLACQLRAADRCVSAGQSPCGWVGWPRLMEVLPAANRGFGQLASSQQHQPAPLAHAQATAVGGVCRSHGLSFSAAAVAVAQQATSHAGLHTASSRLSADGASSTDPAQGRRPVPGINPLQMSPKTVAGAIGSPTAAVPQLAASAAAASEPRRARAIARNLSISPQKLNDFATVIRRMHVQDAVMQCRYSVKKAAKIVEKALVQAAANAENNHGMQQDHLYVEHAFVGRGQHLKRMRMHGRGRSAKMHKYRSHLTVILMQQQARRRPGGVKLRPPLLLRSQPAQRRHLEHRAAGRPSTSRRQEVGI